MNFIQKHRVWFSVSARYLLGFLIVAWLLNTNLIDLSVLGQINARVAIIASLMVVIQVLLAAWRVKLLLVEHGIPAHFWQCVSYNCVGIFYSLFLPGGMSGDLARAYCFWRAHPDASKSALFGALFVDRLIGTVAMLLLGLFAGTLLMTALGLQKFVIASWVGFILFSGTYYLLVRFNRTGNKAGIGVIGRLVRFIEKIDLQGYRVGIVAGTAILGLIGHLSAVIIIYLCADLVQSGLGFFQIIAVAPVGMLANALPLTPGGIGIGEKGFELLFKMIGGQNGGNSFLLTRIFIFSPAILGAITVLYQFVRYHKKVASVFEKNSIAPHQTEQ